MGEEVELGHYPALPLPICVTLDKSSCPLKLMFLSWEMGAVTPSGGG